MQIVVLTYSCDHRSWHQRLERSWGSCHPIPCLQTIKA